MAFVFLYIRVIEKDLNCNNKYYFTARVQYPKCAYGPYC